MCASYSVLSISLNPCVQDAPVAHIQYAICNLYAIYIIPASLPSHLPALPARRPMGSRSPPQTFLPPQPFLTPRLRFRPCLRSLLCNRAPTARQPLARRPGLLFVGLPLRLYLADSPHLYELVRRLRRLEQLEKPVEVDQTKPSQRPWCVFVCLWQWTVVFDVPNSPEFAGVELY